MLLWNLILLNNLIDGGKSDKKSVSPRKSKRSNAELLAAADAIADNKDEINEQPPVAAPRTHTAAIANHINEKDDEASQDTERKSNSAKLMPPPPAPTAADETLNRRPQRAAKLKSEKNLKEPKLGTKLRRPTNDEIKIKLEHEQRPSQMHEATINKNTTRSTHSGALSDDRSKESLSSQKSDNSVVIVPGKQLSIVSIASDIDDASVASETTTVVNQNKGQSKYYFFTLLF